MNEADNGHFTQGGKRGGECVPVLMLECSQYECVPVLQFLCFYRETGREGNVYF